MAQWAKEFAVKPNALILSAEPTWQKDKKTHANWLTPATVCVCVYMYTYIYLYIHTIHIHVHTYVYTYTYT